MVVGNIYSRKLPIVLDTAATVNVISHSTYTRYFFRYPLLPFTSQISTADGRLTPPAGRIKLQVGLGGANWKDEFVVVKGFPRAVLLGRNTLKQQKIDILNSENCAILARKNQKQVRVPLISDPSEPDTVKLVSLETITIPARHQMLISVQPLPSKTGSPTSVYGYVTSIPGLSDVSIFIGKGVVTLTAGVTAVLISNFGAKAYHIKAGQPVALLQHHNPDDYDHINIDLEKDEESHTHLVTDAIYMTMKDIQSSSMATVDLEDLPADLNIGLASELSDAELHQILVLVHEYKELFTEQNLQAPVDPSAAQHKIELTSSKIPHEPPRRHSPKQRQVIKESIQSQLDRNVIRPSSSPFAAGIVLIPKKNTDELRFCIDYRQLNKITKKDVYPLPRIDDALDALGGSTYFSTFDLRSGYWQIPVAEADKEKTAFISHEGLYEYNVMPFGLTNAPATFQRLMDVVLSGLKWQCCLVYLDDIVIFSKSFDGHIEDIRRVFQRLKERRLQLKSSKCHICCQEISYLGHRITPQGIRPDPAKLDAVKLFPKPMNVKEVERFLGLAGYYRRFIAQFAMIAAPLTELTKKNVPWHWTSLEETAFQDLKNRLTSDPILALPDFSRGFQFKVQTDASDVGIGAILCQEDANRKERVIAYASRKLTPLELKWHTQEKEALAIVWACSMFRHYLIGDPFVIESDHGSLQWLNTATKGRLARWAMSMSEYDYQIRHRSGKRNANADALSRAPIDPERPLFTENGRIDELYMINASNPRYHTRASMSSHPASVMAEAQRLTAKRNLDSIDEPHTRRAMRKRKPTTDVSNTAAIDEIAQNLDNQHTDTITMDRRESTAVQMEIRSDDQAQSSHPTLDESVDKAYHTVREELISDSTKEVQKFMNIDVTDATLRDMVRQSQTQSTIPSSYSPLTWRVV
ncbi:hypothetical protein SeMB42_g04060 [Synchytrium endobioticum]|uniref:RNA-directed DNA polymerase n=1 Tax=Synchytrium endobioticum TaxID=286115 RepID=A0A507D216_9FUNG|nr:hypothetical protein SeMB42_g04060 [Synchytrium endobioticum]